MRPDMFTLAGVHARESRASVPVSATVAGLGTARLRDLLAGPAARGRVAHAGRDAVYVVVDGRCFGVLSRNAVHVPCGIATTLPSLSGMSALGSALPGDTAYAGDGRLLVGGLAVTVSRLVDAVPPSLPDPAAAHALLATTLEGDAATAAVRAELPPRSVDALAAGEPEAVTELLGRGSGLTPVGDDVLAGWLATARAAGHPALDRVGAAVARLAPQRTTALSATLLDCAIAGEAIPQFRRLLAALAGGDAPAPDAATRAALTALLRVGHTSGAGLALGCLLALAPEVEPVQTEGTPA